MHSVKSNILYGFNRKMYLTHRDASRNRIADMIIVIESGDQCQFTPPVLWVEFIVHQSAQYIGLLQFKIVHRIHWTKLRLSKWFSDVDPFCDRCKCNPASHTHMFWSCPKLDHYWSSIFDTMSGFLGQPMSPCPLIGLFGVIPEHLGLTRVQSNCIAFLTLLARQLVLIKWKDCKPPTFTHWVKDALYFLKLE